MEKLSVRSTRFPDLPTRANPLSLFFPAAIFSVSIPRTQIQNHQDSIKALQSSILNVPYSFLIRFFRITKLVPVQGDTPPAQKILTVR